MNILRCLCAAILALCTFSIPASATMRCFWCDHEFRSAVSRHHHKHHKPKRHHRSEPAHTERKVIIHVEPESVGSQCVDQRVTVVSTPHQDEITAREAAEMQWRARAQFMVGGLYMDPSLSKDRKWLCSITDPRDAISGTLSEATAKLAGKSGELYRCYFSARPCRANIEFDDHE